MLHFFDPEIAVQYGVDEAVFIQNLRFWLHRNEANGENFHENKFWSYNSRRAMAELFPYWTEKQIRRIVDKLKAAGVLETGCFNENKYDRTAWYTLRADLMIKKIPPKEQVEDSQGGGLDWPKWANERADMGQTLTTDRNTDKYIGAAAPKNASTPRVPENRDVKKSVLTVSDLVAEGVNQDHARDWLKIRGKKVLTPTAWARLKTEAAKHGASAADAVRVCAEWGWQGLSHDGAAKAFSNSQIKKDPKHWEPEDPNKICISPTGEKWFMGRKVI